MSAASDAAKEALAVVLDEAKTAFSPLGAKYKAQLAELEDDSKAVVADVESGLVTADEAKSALASATRAVRSILVSGGYDAADKAPGVALAIIEKILPIVIKLVLA